MRIYLKENKITTKDNALLEKIDTSPILDGITYYDFLKRPGITINDLEKILNLNMPYENDVKEQVEISIKYEGYIKKAEKEAQKLKQLESIKIPNDFNYAKISNIASEARQKLENVKPLTLGQASRISGVNPSDIAVLSVVLKRGKYE